MTGQRLQSRSKRSRAMTRQQAATLLAADLTPWLRAYITTGLMLGPRPGELLALVLG